jgi:DNA repair exonuclease SbcCD nuclease subunit
MTYNGKFVIIGDTHFGASSFNLKTYENQLKFFENQLIPYMIENDIKLIIQTGDFLDNRRQVDIDLFDRLMKLMDYIEDKGISIISYIGNHDIYYKNTREVNLMKYIEKMYPKTINLIQDETRMNINGKECLFVPWLIENEKIVYNTEIVFGHFEIKDFAVSRGVVDTHSEMSVATFKKPKRVYSGHYHIRNKISNIQYVGIPYQLNWNDFGNECGFTVIDEDWKETFIMNSVSKRHCIMNYTDEGVQIDFGFDILPVMEYKVFVDYLSKNKVLFGNNAVIKFNINKCSDNKYEDFIFVLKDIGAEFTVINNQEIDQIINPEKVEIKTSQNTTDFIINYVKDNVPDLLELTTSVLEEAFGSLGKIDIDL